MNLARRFVRRWASFGSERGQLGGVEMLPFGFLIFACGVLLAANAWAVVDARLVVEAAAREAVRAYVEAPNADQAPILAKAAADETLRGHHRDPAKAEVTPSADTAFGRCQLARYRVTYHVPVVILPWIKGLNISGFTATATHTEVVDPYRSGLRIDRGEPCG